MGKVKVNSVLYFNMFSDKKLSALSFFVLLQKKNSSKRFFYKTRTELYSNLSKLSGLSVGSVHKNITTLKKYGLIVESKNKLELLSKENQNILYAKDKIITIPEQIQTLSQIKYFLKSLNFLCNLVSQKKKAKLMEHLSTIKAKIENGIRVSANDFKLYAKIYKRGQTISKEKTDLRLSNFKGALFIGKSKKTLIGYKKRLIQANLLKSFKVFKVIQFNCTYFDYLQLRTHHFNFIQYSFYNHSTNQILKREANSYLI